MSSYSIYFLSCGGGGGLATLSNHVYWSHCTSRNRCFHLWAILLTFTKSLILSPAILYSPFPFSVKYKESVAMPRPRHSVQRIQNDDICLFLFKYISSKVEHWSLTVNQLTLIKILNLTTSGTFGNLSLVLLAESAYLLLPKTSITDLHITQRKRKREKEL